MLSPWWSESAGTGGNRTRFPLTTQHRMEARDQTMRQVGYSQSAAIGAVSVVLDRLLRDVDELITGNKPDIETQTRVEKK